MTCYRFGDHRFDAERWTLGDPRGTVALRRKTALLLCALLDAPDRLLTKEALFARVWPDAAVTDNTLAQSVQELRRALGDDPRRPRFIKTYAKRGYQWVGPHAEAVDDRPSHPAGGAGRPVAGRRRWPRLAAGIAVAAVTAAGLGALLWLPTTPAPPPSAAQALARGCRLLETAGPTAARAVLADAAAARPPSAQAQAALALAETLRGDWQTATTLFHQVVERADQVSDPALEAWAWRELAGIALLRMNLDQARGHLQRALRVSAALDDPQLQAWLHRAWTWALTFAGDRAAAADHDRVAADLERTAGAAVARSGFAALASGRLRMPPWVASGHDDPDALRRDLAAFRERGDLGNQAVTLHRLAADPDLSVVEKRGLYDRALQLFSEIGNRRGIARTLSDIGFLEILQRDDAKAIEPLRQSLTTYQELGEVLQAAKNELYLGMASMGLASQAPEALRRPQLAAAVRWLTGAEDTFARLRFVDRVAVVCQLSLGAAELALGERREARERFGRARRWSERLGLYEERTLALLGVAQLHMLDGAWQRAIASLAEPVAGDGDLPLLVHRRLGRCHYQLRDYRQAVAAGEAGRRSGDLWSPADEHLLGLYRHALATGEHTPLPPLGDLYLEYLESRARAVLHR